MNRGLLGLACLALVLTGCSTPVSGTASPNQAAVQRIEEEANTPLTAAEALGEFTTIDYCGMIDPALLPADKAAAAGDPISSFDYCLLPVTIDGKPVELEVGYLAGKSAAESARVTDPTRKLPRGLVVQRLRDLSDEYRCAYFLKFADDVTIEISSTSYPDADNDKGVGTTVLCEVSSAMLEGVATAVTEDKVAHRDFPAGSLGTVDACTLIDDEAIRRNLGLGPAKTPALSRHRCRWAGPDTNSVSLTFASDKPYTTPGQKTETLGNRSSVVAGSGGSQFCTVTTTLGPVPEAKNGEVVTATLFTRVKGKDSCAVGRALATVAWPKLPPM